MLSLPTFLLVCLAWTQQKHLQASWALFRAIEQFSTRPNHQKKVLLFTLTNPNFTLPASDCSQIREELLFYNADLITIIMTPETGSFHRLDDSNELFGCLYGEEIDPIVSKSLWVFDTFEELASPETFARISDRVCFGTVNLLSSFLLFSQPVFS